MSVSARSTLQFQPGQVIDRRYEIVRHLGDGGLGTVYLAKQVLLGRQVAIKFIPLIGKAGGIDPATLFTQEAQVQAKLTHPNIVAAIDGGILDKRFPDDDLIGYLVMEFVDGAPLRQVLGAPVARLKAASILMQVARGLGVVHAARVLHRDLKPENVLVAGDGTVKLLDWGNARITGASKYRTMSPQPIGTLHYMPYEQLMNTGMDETVDTFSLGVMAFELLTGAHPRARAGQKLPTKDDVLGALVAKEPMPALAQHAPDVPASVAAVIDRAIAFAPDARPRAAELEKVFTEWLAELASARGPATVVSAGSPPRGTERMQTPVAAAVLPTEAMSIDPAQLPEPTFAPIATTPGRGTAKPGGGTALALGLGFVATAVALGGGLWALGAFEPAASASDARPAASAATSAATASTASPSSRPEASPRGQEAAAVASQDPSASAAAPSASAPLVPAPAAPTAAPTVRAAPRPAAPAPTAHPSAAEAIKIF